MANDDRSDLLLRPDIPRTHRWLFLLILMSPALLVNRQPDNDVWFILSSGRHVLEQGIPWIEPLSLHSNFAFVMQQWLSALLFWLSYLVMGNVGLVLIASVAYALLILVVYKLAMLISDQYFIVSFAVTMLTSILFYPCVVTRPLVLSVLIFAIEILVLETWIRQKKWGLLVWIPVLSVVLINLHAALWPMLFIVAGPYLVESLLARPLRANRDYPATPLWIAGFFSLVAGLINPYGFKAMTYFFRSIGHSEINTMIKEMRPIGWNLSMGKLFFITVGLIVLVLLKHRSGQFRIRYVLLALGLTGMVLAAFRNYVLFAALVPFQLADYLRNFRFPEPRSDPKPVDPRRMRLIALALVMLIGLLAVFAGRLAPPDTDQQDLFAILHEVQTESQAKPAEIRLYTGYNDGGHAEFLGLAPYIDPRADVFVQENNGQKDVMAEYYALYTGRLHYREFLGRYGFTHLVVGDGDLLKTYLAADPDYRLVKTIGTYELYVAR